MKPLVDLQKKLFPDLLEIMQRRYRILYYIQLLGPIGRRSLSENSNMPERLVRSEVDFLHQNGKVAISSKGMILTAEGKEILEQLGGFMDEIAGIRILERQVKDKLQLEHVVVVPGNSDQYDQVKREMGKSAAEYLSSILTPGEIIAVTGGSSMAAVAEMMAPLEKAEHCMFVPARGGLGERVENQANTICAEMARKANGEYRMLYVPDPLGEETYQSIIQEPAVKEVLNLIHQAGVIVHGIGDALTMARRRKASEKVIAKLQAGNAVSEAFGYYFDNNGHVVHKVRTAGLQLEDLKGSKCILAVAGGESKSEAIFSYFKQGKSNVLVTDEGAAKALIGEKSP